MIVEIPGAEDFSRASINLLNLAWQIALGSLDAYDNSSVIHPFDLPERQLRLGDGSIVTIGGPDTTFTPQERAEAELQYWRRCQPALGNALSLVQQAIEMGFKGRIAEVSPFLLIVREPRDYPSGSATQDVPFSAFRSLDAADLMRVHNSVCRDRLSVEFGARWDALRRRRNALIHSVVPNAELLRPVDLAEMILWFSKALHPARDWFWHRLDFVQNDELEVAYSPQPEQGYGAVLREFDVVLGYLPPKFVRAHFGLDRRSREYICTHCMADCDPDTWYDAEPGRHAQLVPKGPTSTSLLCRVCGRASMVTREPCGYPGCASNVLSAEADSKGLCLVCAEDRPEPDD